MATLEIKTADELTDPAREARWAARRAARETDVDIAYPFSAVPTPFVVRLPDGKERFTCCAIDALGVAPMLGQRVDIRTRCHDCDTPLDFSADPDAPGPEADGVMSRSHGGRGVQAGPPRLRWTSERRLTMLNRAVTVYWSTT